MLKLIDIVKTYSMGDSHVEALKGIDLEFRKSDFVSILGPSGCGKTTLLNIIGGLDRYTSGDLMINGVSSKEYSDGDWDVYRNKSIGFVFQSYNLISHQTAFANVELAMTLAGVSSAERKKRVTEVLEKVGLGDQVHKKPTQMSGGQMQRVAIARALINNPEILLADEPTGALDSETSRQIMQLLNEIAKDRLVIMVTHNPDLAEEYSTRIIKLLDGRLVGDTSPYSSGEGAAEEEKTKRKKAPLSFSTALSLSLKNLLTKKTRTILTAFAGSIGIIGIALILSLSNGMQGYVDGLARDTLSTYPIELTSQSMDMGGIMSMLMESNSRGKTSHELDEIYSNNIMTDMMQQATAQIQQNDLAQFKKYLEGEGGRQFFEYANSIQYGYDVELQIFKSDTSNGVTQINPSEVLSSLNMGMSSGGGMSLGMDMGMGSSELWSELLANEDLSISELYYAQYDVVAGRWPSEYNEVVLVVNRNNEISDINLYALGLLDSSDLDELRKRALRGESLEDLISDRSFSFDEILSLTFKLLLNTDYYVKEGNAWVDKRDDAKYMEALINNALEIKVVGIVRPAEGAAASSINGSIGYMPALTIHVVNEIHKTAIAKEQLAKPETNVFSGMPFKKEGNASSLTMADVAAIIAALPEEQQAQMQMMLAAMTEEEIIKMFEQQIKASEGNATYEENISVLGIVDFDTPNAIRLYPKDFNAKTELEKLIEGYNKMQEDAGNEEYIIRYNDFVGLMTSSISSVIGLVSYVLIAFVAISLIVSSIMIAIITYISVLERTKEIGILRSIGASKKDITRVFNAETIIEGFFAGGIGIVVTLLLLIPINAVIQHFTEIVGLSVLPLFGAVGLIAISVVLALVAGFIPSKMAAKKDPVEALRTE